MNLKQDPNHIPYANKNTGVKIPQECHCIKSEMSYLYVIYIHTYIFNYKSSKYLKYY